MRRELVIAGVLALAAPARANPADIFGLGARGTAMGGAQVAATDDGTAAYYNPARLVRGDDIHIDIGYQFAQPYVGTSEDTFAVDSSRGLAFDIAVPGQVAGARIAIAAALFLPDQHVTRTRTLPEARPRYLAYDNRPQRIVLAAVGAIQILPGLSVGGGVAYMSSASGSVFLRGLVGFPDAAASDLDLAIDVDVETIRYPHAGVAWSVLPWLELGASYRGGFRLVSDLSVHVRGDIGAPGQPPVVEDGRLDLRSVSLDLFQPMQITGGLAAQVTSSLLVAFDLAWHRWSVFENPTAKIDIELDIKDFNDLVNIPPQVPLAPANLNDIFVPRLGVEWKLPWGPRTLAVRGGYVYEPSVAPEQKAATNFLDNDKHTLLLGGGLDFAGIGEVIPRPVSIDAVIGVTVLEPREHHKVSPIDPVGDYRSTGWVMQAGVTTRWRF